MFSFFLCVCLVSFAVNTEAKCRPGFNTRNYGYCKGNVIDTIFNISDAACQITCGEKCGCNGFRYRFDNKTCWHQKVCPLDMPGVFVREPGYLSGSWNFDRYKSVKLDCPGHDYNYRREISSEWACMNLCNQRCLCAAAVYNDKTKECFLKYKCEPSVTGPTVTMIKERCQKDQCTLDNCGNGGINHGDVAKCRFGFNTRNYGYCKGNVIDTIFNISHSTCVITCGVKCGCNGFRYKFGNRTCWHQKVCPLDMPGVFVREPRVFVREPRYLSGSWNFDRYKFAKLDCPGHDYDYKTEISSEWGCSSLCDHRCLCAAAAYNRETKECFLKYKCEPSVVGPTITMIKERCRKDQCTLDDCGNGGTTPGVVVTSTTGCPKTCLDFVPCPAVKCGKGQVCIFRKGTEPAGNICN